MDYRLREFTISSIRSGIIFVKDPRLCIHPPTINQIVESYEVYQDAYVEAQNEDIMTVEETESWMRAKGYWQTKDDEELEKIPKDLEDAKCKLYQNRKDTKALKYNRSIVRFLEKLLEEKLHKKNAYYTNTCESYAEINRLTWILKQTTYRKNKLYDIDTIADVIVEQYQNSIISDQTIRFLARNEPWRSLWITSTKGNFPLFFNKKNVDVTINQKNLVLWSQTYDNLQECLDPPTNDIIEDDDLLDGWFILQRKNREREKKQKDVESMSKNQKINSAKELFIVSNPNMTTEDINDLNEDNAKFIKHQRKLQLTKTKSIDYEYLPDIQLEGKREINEKFKNHIKRK